MLGLVAAAAPRWVRAEALADEGKWEACKPSTLATEFAPAVVGPDGRIYVFGGRTNENQGSRHIAATRIYDPATDVWSEAAPIPTPRVCPGAALGPEGKIYVIGSEVGRHALDMVEVYDPKTDRWAARKPLPTARTDPSVVAAKGADGRVRLYVIGGRDFIARTNGLHTVEAYDPVADTWDAKAPMPTHRHAQTEALGPDGRIYVIGGAHDRPVYTNAMEAYDPVKDAWAECEPLPYRIECAMCAATSGPDGEILVFGGWETLDKVATTKAVAYCPRTKRWRSLPPLPTARAAGAAVCIQTPDGIAHVYVLGGIPSGQTLEHYSFRPGRGSQ
jgi:N-acetylneuraminic acid mutarotase